MSMRVADRMVILIPVRYPESQDRRRDPADCKVPLWQKWRAGAVFVVVVVVVVDVVVVRRGRDLAVVGWW